MAGGKERELRRRIKSIRSTRKITKAMELIAASQIARAQSRIAANRPYREGIASIVREAAKGDAVAAAKLLGVPASWMLAQARAEKIPHHKIGRYVRFDIDELIAWVDQNKIPPK